MSQLDRNSQRELFTILVEHISPSPLVRVLLHNGLPSLDELSPPGNHRDRTQSVISELSKRHQILPLLEGALVELDGSCPPLQEWIDRHRDQLIVRIVTESSNAETPTESVDAISNPILQVDSPENKIRILHLSDLHFRFDDLGGTARHSVSFLNGIEDLYQNQSFDFFLVSGDITSLGDRNALERAYGWLHKSEMFEGEERGLRLKQRGQDRQLIVVPGDSDHSTKPGGGTAVSRSDRGLYYFDQLFTQSIIRNPRASFIKSPSGEAVVLFTCRIPPSIDDVEHHDHASGNAAYSSSEIREILKHEWNSISEVHYSAVDNGLESSATLKLTPHEYRRSAKLLVSHHPLISGKFAAVEAHYKGFIKRLSNIGVNVVVCGHGHEPSWTSIELRDLRTRRDPVQTVNRYLRAVLGASKVPSQLTLNGRRMRRTVVPFLLPLLKKAKEAVNATFQRKTSPPTEEAILGECQRILREYLVTDSLTRAELWVEQLRSNLVGDEADEISLEEFGILERALSELRVTDRRMLTNTLREKPIADFYRRFLDMPFLQCRCGSSGKAMGPSGLQRSVNVYEVQFSDDSWSISCLSYEWKDGAFVVTPKMRKQDFQR